MQQGDINSGKSTLARQLIANLNMVTNVKSLEHRKIHLYYCYNGNAGMSMSTIMNYVIINNFHS